MTAQKREREKGAYTSGVEGDGGGRGREQVSVEKGRQSLKEGCAALTLGSQPEEKKKMRK
jgi:hypothetical protein